MKRLGFAAALISVGVAGLFLDSAAHLAVTRLGLPAWLDQLYLVPLAIAAVLYVVTGPDRSWRLPEHDFMAEDGIKLVLAWLGAAAAMVGLSALALGRDAILPAIAMMTTHLVAQELYFRGALVQLGLRLWPADPRDDHPRYVAVLLLAGLVYGAAQLQYSGFEPTLPVIFQALRGFVFGFLLAAVRVFSRSLWPSVAGHAIISAIAALRG